MSHHLLWHYKRLFEQVINFVDRKKNFILIYPENDKKHFIVVYPNNEKLSELSKNINFIIYQPLTFREKVNFIIHKFLGTSPSMEVSISHHFSEWVQSQNISLACTTAPDYQLLLLGSTVLGELSVSLRHFADNARGLYASVDAEYLYMGTRDQIWRFNNTLNSGQLYQDRSHFYDKLYVPRISYGTKNLDIFDVAVNNDGQVIVAAAGLNALATLEQHSYTPLWHPPFISEQANEDRCHLTGFAMVAGQPRYVTTASQSDVINGWQNKRRDGGCVIDVQNNKIILSGLSMPHSPRFYQGKLWLLNSGQGEFGYLEPQTGQFKPMTFCPGYARGLAFSGHFAIISLSKLHDKYLSDLALSERLAAKKIKPRCGLIVVDINNGNIVHWMYYEGSITECRDVQILPQVRRAISFGFDAPESYQMISSHQIHQLLKKLIEGQRILILGSGPSVLKLKKIPDDVKIFTCNSGLKHLIDRGFKGLVDLYLTNKWGVNLNPNILALLRQVPVKILMIDFPEVTWEQAQLANPDCKLVYHEPTNNRYFQSLIEPYDVTNICGNSRPWTSTGIMLLQFALYFKAKEIYIAGIDFGSRHFYPEIESNPINGHITIDHNFMWIVSKKFDNIYSVSEESPITRYIPFKELK